MMGQVDLLMKLDLNKKRYFHSLIYISLQSSGEAL